MQQAINIQEVENAMNKYGDIVLSKNSNNNIIVMSVEQYRDKLKDKEIEEKAKTKAINKIEELKVKLDAETDEDKKSRIEKKLNDQDKRLKEAERQIEEGKTIKATEVFKELEEKYGF